MAAPSPSSSPAPFSTLMSSMGQVPPFRTTKSTSTTLVRDRRWYSGPYARISRDARHMANSTYVRQVQVPSDGREVAVAIPEGFLPVRVVNALKNQPVAGATITWTGSGARVEAAATASGEALLEGVGTAGGTLAASAHGYEPAQEQLTEPPGVPYTIALMPLPPATNVRLRVVTTSGEPLPNAVVELIS